jgi:hypothetical protein
MYVCIHYYMPLCVTSDYYHTIVKPPRKYIITRSALTTVSVAGHRRCRSLNSPHSLPPFRLTSALSLTKVSGRRSSQPLVLLLLPPN